MCKVLRARVAVVVPLMAFVEDTGQKAIVSMLLYAIIIVFYWMLLDAIFLYCVKRKESKFNV